MQQRIKMRPTLLVGLGGTGQKVLLQLKARFIRNYGEVPPAVEFLCFDTDQATEQAQVDGKVVQLTPRTELIYIGGVETAEILRNLDKYPAIAAWIAEDKEHISLRPVTMGAHQVRPLGRLSLFWHMEEVRRRLETSVHRLTHLRLDVAQPSVNAFIVSSVCGGTGSGAILDVAYLMRHVIRAANLPADACYINAVLALPSVFRNVDEVGIASNAYACLAELDYFMETVSWTCDYGSQRVPVVDFAGKRPFDICYLVDARNERGQGLSGMDEVASMAAEAMYLQIASQVGDANLSSFDNIEVLAGHTPNAEEGKPKPTAFSSLGTASLVFPAGKIIELCANRLGKGLIQDELLRPAPAAVQIDGAVSGFLQASKLETAALLQQLARDAKGNLTKVTLNPNALARFKDAELYGAARAYLAKAESAVDNELSQMLEANRKAMAEDLSAAVIAEADRLADDRTFGPRGALAFLEKLDATLTTARRELDEKARPEMDKRRGQATAAARQTDQALVDALRSGNPLGRGRRIREACSRHVETWQNCLTARFELRKLEEAIALLAALSQHIQARRASLQNLVDRLQFIAGRFETFVERYGGDQPRVDFVLAQDITDAADIERYYSVHYDRLGTAPASAMLQTKGPLHAWLDLSQDQISDLILDYARAVFADIGETSIEDVILEKRGQVDPARRLQDLIDRSVPFWRFRREGELNQDWRGARIIVIGVADTEHSIYGGDLQQDQRLAQTFDRHQITVLQTRHGVPLFALMQFREYRRVHDEVLRQAIKPLYVIPEVRPGGEKAKQVFALGLAYGFVFKSGVFYFVIPEDPGRPPIQLAQGMSESLRIFGNNDSMIRHVERLVVAQIEREGSETAIQTLDGFVDEPFVYELKGGAARTNIDRTVMGRDTSIGRPGSVNHGLVMELRETIKAYLKKVVRG